MYMEYIKNIKIDNDKAYELESLRYQAFNMNDKVNKDGYYFSNILNESILVYAYYKDSKIIGACYITPGFDGLNIDQLFVSPEYSRKHIGSKLLQCILDSKKFIEDYFNRKFDRVVLESVDSNSDKFYSANYFKQYSKTERFYKRF